jgi:dTDP-4-amino-4,6-dideoxygalactose transaminase
MMTDHGYARSSEGTNRSQFLRGQVDKYTWVDIGSSYVPSDILAAFLVGQLETMEKITEKRRLIYNQYSRMLAPLAERGLIRLPIIAQYCSTNYHIFYIITSNIEQRTALIAHLREAGILAVFHYVPLHSSPYGQSLKGCVDTLPLTEAMSARVLRLPLYYDMSEAHVANIGEPILDFYHVQGLS